MTARARKVIDAALDAWLHDDGGESTRADQILSALAAAGLAIYDTATHAAVPREEAEWQPIETAPKDGTRVQLWWPYWSDIPCIGRFALGCWESNFALDDDGPGPTHWRPLPSPPTEAEAKGGENGP